MNINWALYLLAALCCGLAGAFGVDTLAHPFGSLLMFVGGVLTSTALGRTGKVRANNVR